MTYGRYRPFPPIDLPDRTWPNATVTVARAGLLPTSAMTIHRPMSPGRKMTMFDLLCPDGLRLRATAHRGDRFPMT